MISGRLVEMYEQLVDGQWQATDDAPPPQDNTASDEEQAEGPMEESTHDEPPPAQQSPEEIARIQRAMAECRAAPRVEFAVDPDSDLPMNWIYPVSCEFGPDDAEENDCGNVSRRSQKKDSTIAGSCFAHVREARRDLTVHVSLGGYRTEADGRKFADGPHSDFTMALGGPETRRRGRFVVTYHRHTALAVVGAISIALGAGTSAFGAISFPTRLQLSDGGKWGLIGSGGGIIAFGLTALLLRAAIAGFRVVDGDTGHEVDVHTDHDAVEPGQPNDW